jgi:hypothetical protein
MVQLVLGELVLLAASVQLAAGRIELPVNDIDAAQNRDGKELRLNIDNVLLIGRDPNRMRVDPRAPPPQPASTNPAKTKPARRTRMWTRRFFSTLFISWIRTCISFVLSKGSRHGPL